MTHQDIHVVMGVGANGEPIVVVVSNEGQLTVVLIFSHPGWLGTNSDSLHLVMALVQEFENVLLTCWNYYITIGPILET